MIMGQEIIRSKIERSYRLAENDPVLEPLTWREKLRLANTFENRCLAYMAIAAVAVCIIDVLWGLP